MQPWTALGATNAIDAAAPRRTASAAIWSASLLAHAAVLAVIVTRFGAKPIDEPPVAPPIAIEIAAPSPPAQSVAHRTEPVQQDARRTVAQPLVPKAAPPRPPTTHALHEAAAANAAAKPMAPSQDVAAAQPEKAAMASAAPPASASMPIAAAPAPEPVVTPPIGNAGYLHNPPPHYPQIAQEEGWEGRAVLRVHVDASGHPISVELHQSSGHDVLDKAALAATRQWTFVPAKRGATPIDGWVDVPLDFRLN
jgi:protein TonB